MSTGTIPTKTQRETLEAIARLEQGSWESFRREDVQECIEKGWVEIIGSRYRLTEAGREALRRRDQSAATPLSAAIHECVGCPA
jgi:DNA-binding PadR family transcriptional regulator